MEPILKLDHIQKYYGNEGNITKAIQDISFSVEAGEFLGIMGASGSGKTTLLNCISTIDTVSAGHIYLEGTDITEIKPKSLARFRRENLGFVFQDFNLLDTLTISENIALALAIIHCQILCAYLLSVYGNGGVSCRVRNRRVDCDTDDGSNRNLADPVSFEMVLGAVSDYAAVHCGYVGHHCAV